MFSSSVPGKEVWILQHHPELAAQFHRIELAEVASADADRSFLNIVKPQ